MRAFRGRDPVKITGTDIDPSDRQRDAADHGNPDPRPPGPAEQVTECASTAGSAGGLDPRAGEQFRLVTRSAY